MEHNPKERCYEELQSRILTLVLTPGSPLDEGSLSAEFGISRTPLREVLQRLAGGGFISLERNRSAVVSSMDLRVMHDFFQTAPMVYAATSRLAAEHADKAGVDALKDVQHSFKLALQDKAPERATLANHRFHALIGELSGNPYLQPSIQRLLIDHARMGRIFYKSETAEDSARIETAWQQHDSLIEAIEAREPAEAVRITLEHWDLSRNEIERYVRPDPFPLDLAQIQKEDVDHAV